MNCLKYMRYLKNCSQWSSTRLILCHNFIWLLSFIENVHLGAKDSFGSKLKKILVRIFFFKKKDSAKRVHLFLLHQMLSLFPTINLVYVPEINNFGKDRIIQIWIISFKDINIQCLCKIYCGGLGQYLMQFDALEKE